MARRKGKATRGKSRVSQVPMGPTEQELRDTYAVLVRMESSVTGHCPLCALTGADHGPYGDARDIERAAVEPVQRGID